MERGFLCGLIGQQRIEGRLLLGLEGRRVGRLAIVERVVQAALLGVEHIRLSRLRRVEGVMFPGSLHEPAMDDRLLCYQRVMLGRVVKLRLRPLGCVQGRMDVGVLALERLEPLVIKGCFGRLGRVQGCMDGRVLRAACVQRLVIKGRFRRLRGCQRGVQCIVLPNQRIQLIVELGVRHCLGVGEGGEIACLLAVVVRIEVAQ